MVTMAMARRQGGEGWGQGGNSDGEDGTHVSGLGECPFSVGGPGRGAR